MCLPTIKCWRQNQKAAVVMRHPKSDETSPNQRLITKQTIKAHPPVPHGGQGPPTLIGFIIYISPTLVLTPPRGLIRCGTDSLELKSFTSPRSFRMASLPKRERGAQEAQQIGVSTKPEDIRNQKSCWGRWGTQSQNMFCRSQVFIWPCEYSKCVDVEWLPLNGL